MGLNKITIQIIKFAIVGIIAAIIDFLTLVILKEFSVFELFWHQEYRLLFL